jgi:hypothetical protein
VGVRNVLLPMASGLTAACVVPYLVGIARGVTHPQRTSWFVFAVLATVAAVSQFADGATAGVWLSGGAAVGFGVVFVASLRRGVGGCECGDLLTLVLAAIGIGLWLTTGEAVVAVLAVIVADGAAVALTVGKARRDPDSEAAASWVLDASAGAVALLGGADWTFTEAVYPAYHVVANLAVLGAIWSGRRLRAADQTNGRMVDWHEGDHERTRGTDRRRAAADRREGVGHRQLGARSDTASVVDAAGRERLGLSDVAPGLVREGPVG